MKNKVFIFLCLAVIKGFSLAISPINLEINSSKGQGYYTIINDDKTQKVVAINIKSRTIDEDGNSHLASTKDIIIYPKQVVLKAKEKRLVRVIWKAKERISSEKAYRISFAEQNVDVDFGEKDLEKGERRAGLSFGVCFDGTVYVEPKKGGTPNVEIANYDKTKEEGEEFFILKLKNSGTKHKYISTKDLELEVLHSSKEIGEKWHLLSEEILNKYAGDSILLLAGGERRIKIPCKEREIPENVLGVRITE